MARSFVLRSYKSLEPMDVPYKFVPHIKPPEKGETKEKPKEDL